MNLSRAAGARLGPYELGPAIGAGGMGEVYRARDPRLGRDVAIKILPPEVADDPDRLRRFEQEARAAAALNHPNILSVHDVGADNGVAYLVTELLEGGTLREGMSDKTSGPDVFSAVGYAGQIADGLAAAHARGIVHRDLKPENVFVTTDGRVKILDFGLAKVFEAGLKPTPYVPPEDPTVLSPTPTASGVILGTVGYMAPEQIRGQAVDARTDIFAFGCVLYEMLAGRRAFSGETPFDTLSAILKDTPASLASQVPDGAIAPPLARIVERCLEKAPAARFQSAADLAFALREGTTAPGAPIAPASRRGALKAWLPWALVAGVALTVTGGLVGWWLRPPAVPVQRSPVRFTYVLPDDQVFTRTGRRVLDISPDGRRLAYIANNQIYLRELSELTARPIPGTQGNPRELVFSPDGQWLAYVAPTQGSNTLTKIRIEGGTPIRLCTTGTLGIAWPDDRILFGAGGIQVISSDGGDPQMLVAVPRGEVVGYPQLVGSTHVLFTVRSSEATHWGDGQIVLAPLSGGTRRVLVARAEAGRLAGGISLVFYRDGTLFRQAFDPQALDVRGEPEPIAVDVLASDDMGGAMWAISDAGTLAYAQGSDSGPVTDRQLLWVDRQGREELIPAPPRAYAQARLSPDGTRIAAWISEGGANDLWLWDLVRRSLVRLTYDGRARAPVWTPDGQILYSGGEPGRVGLYRVAATGTGTPELLLGDLADGFLDSLTPDGSIALFRARGDMMRWRIGSNEPPHSLFTTPSGGVFGHVSPDGRWLAYVSGDSRTVSVYVRPFPRVDDGRWQIAPHGDFVWARSSRWLFVLTNKDLMAVRVDPSGTFGEPERILDASAFLNRGSYAGPQFDVSLDGTRFLMIKAVPAGAAEASPPATRASASIVVAIDALGTGPSRRPPQ